MSNEQRARSAPSHSKILVWGTKGDRVTLGLDHLTPATNVRSPPFLPNLNAPLTYIGSKLSGVASCAPESFLQIRCPRDPDRGLRQASGSFGSGSGAVPAFVAP